MKQTKLEELLNEVRLLYQSMVQIGESVHADTGITMGMRAVLEYLSREGDATVPQMARARRVTRQRMQALVNALLELGCVARRENPESQRSQLITISSTGRNTIDQMRRREGSVFRTDLSAEALEKSASILKEVRRSLEGDASQP